MRFENGGIGTSIFSDLGSGGILPKHYAEVHAGETSAATLRFGNLVFDGTDEPGIEENRYHNGFDEEMEMFADLAIQGGASPMDAWEACIPTLIFEKAVESMRTGKAVAVDVTGSSTCPTASCRPASPTSATSRRRVQHFTVEDDRIELPRGATARARRVKVGWRGNSILGLSQGDFRSYVYPVFTPSGVQVTSESPIDHPHHQSVTVGADHFNCYLPTRPTRSRRPTTASTSTTYSRAVRRGASSAARLRLRDRARPPQADPAARLAGA